MIGLLYGCSTFHTMKLNLCFIRRDIPSKKQWSCSLIYSLNVVLHQRPIFCISWSEHPLNDKHSLPHSEENVCQWGQSVFPIICGSLTVQLLFLSWFVYHCLWHQNVGHDYCGVLGQRMQRDTLSQRLYRAVFFFLLACWYMQTPFHPFFFLSSFSMVLGAIIMCNTGAVQLSCCIFPEMSFLKNVMSPMQNWTVCFDWLYDCFTVYSLTRNR